MATPWNHIIQFLTGDYHRIVSIKANPKKSDIPVIFLTALSDIEDEQHGLEIGAVDYITKPIKPSVLVSKVNSLLRRIPIVEAESLVFQAGDIIIDREKYLVVIDGKEIQLARKEFELLSILATKPGRVFTREEILNRVWDDDVVVGERTIDVHIRKIREKTGTDHIKTIKGVGYKFDAR